jgi:uncharacterized protein YjgD (DUF1641 family)
MAPRARNSKILNIISAALGSAQTLPVDVDPNAEETVPAGSMNKPGASFHRHEWQSLITRKDGDIPDTQPPSVEMVRNMLMSISRSTAQQTRTNQSLYALTPELEQAKRIWVSSILAPNDMQTGNINITCTDETLTDTQRIAIGDLTTKFFNDKLRLGTRLAEWIGEFMFETGAKAIVILPKDGLRKLIEDPKAVKGASETLNFSHADIDKMMKDDDVDREFKIAFEELQSTLMQSDPLQKGSIDLAKIVDFSKSYVVQLLNSPDIYRPTVVFDPMEIKKKARSQTDNNQVTLKQYLATLFGDTPGGQSNALILEPVTNVRQGDEPVLLELPTASVVPVCVKGSKSEHLGYFVLIDENGDPVVPREEDWDPSKTLTTATVNQATKAYTGGQSGQSIWSLATDSQKAAHLSAAFTIAVKQLMIQSLKRRGIVSVDIGAYNAISNCLLYNMLSKQKIKLIYVPEPMMVYYCFDYRKDGTGKAITESVEYVLALRSTLFVAYVMSVIQNSIQHRTLTVDVDPKNTQVEQTMNMLREVFVAKHELPFDNNPVAISRDLAKRNISIIPKNIKGLEGGLSVEKDQTLGHGTMIDDALIKVFTNMALSGLGLPHSLFNQLNEGEFARSVTTNNLYYSNDVRMKQSKLEKPNTQLVCNYAAGSFTIREAIRQILATKEEGKTRKEKDDIKTNPGEASTSGTAKVDDVGLLRTILSLRVSLPSPNIAVSKSQFEELEAFMTALDSIVNAVIAEGMFNIQDANLNDTAVQFKAVVKAALVRQYLENVGLNIVDIPDLGELIQQHDPEVVNNLKLMLNYRKQVTDLVKVISGGTTGSADMPSADGSDMGGSDSSSPDSDTTSGGDTGDNATSGDDSSAQPPAAPSF